MYKYNIPATFVVMNGIMPQTDTLKLAIDDALNAVPCASMHTTLHRIMSIKGTLVWLVGAFQSLMRYENE